MTDADARAAFTDPSGSPSHVEMVGIAGALDRGGATLAGGLSPGLASDILMLWFRKTWRSAARSESVVAHPYQPERVPESARRTLEGRLAISIDDAEEIPLRTFAQTVAPPLVRARFFDVLWERFRNPDDAVAAIDAFLSYASIAGDGSWPDVENALGRAASLISLRKDVARVAPLVAAFDSTATSVLGGRFHFAYACIADTLVATVLRSKVLRRHVPAQVLNRWGFVLTWLSESFFGVDAHYGTTCFLVLSEWSASRSMQAEATTSRRRVVEHLLTCASQGSALVGASHASSALDLALRFGFADLVERTKTVIQDRVLASHAEMKTHAFELAIPAEAVAEIDNLVDASPTAGAAVRALATLAGLCDVRIDDVRRAATAQLNQSVFAALMPSMHMRGGKVAFLANDPDAKLREAIARNIDVYLAAVDNLLYRALQRLAPRIVPSTMIEAISGCPWLPNPIAVWLERASERFCAGDMMSSGLIVAMQYEALLRELVRSQGASGLKTDGDGTLMDETLGSLLQQEGLRRTLGEDHLFFVEYVLGNPELGLNLRNELAHGSAAPWALTAPRVLLLWLFTIRLTLFGPIHTPSGSGKTEPSHEEIATAAYFRWLEGGTTNGEDLEDWLLAEQDLRRRLAR